MWKIRLAQATVFWAGFLHQLCQHDVKDLSDPLISEEIVRYASAMGALTTMRAGAIAAQPTAAEVEAFLFLQNLPG